MTDLPPPPKDLPARGDAFRHWKGGVVVVTGVARNERTTCEFDINYVHEGASEDEIPWRRTYSDFMSRAQKDGCDVPRFEPIGRREISSFCRPVVLAFSRAMEEKLRKNEHKGGWQDEDPYDMLARVVDEIDELDIALQEHMKDKDDKEASRKVLSEAADVANFCLFCADLAGSLKGEETLHVGE